MSINFYLELIVTYAGYALLLWFAAVYAQALAKQCRDVWSSFVSNFYSASIVTVSGLVGLAPLGTYGEYKIIAGDTWARIEFACSQQFLMTLTMGVAAMLLILQAPGHDGAETFVCLFSFLFQFLLLVVLYLATSLALEKINRNPLAYLPFLPHDIGTPRGIFAVDPPYPRLFA